MTEFFASTDVKISKMSPSDDVTLDDVTADVYTYSAVLSDNIWRFI